MLGIGEDRLSIYLNDHLAGSTAGVKLAQRVEQHHRSMGAGSALDGLASEIEEDRETLLELMGRFGVRPDRAKAAVAWAAEKAARLKLQGELIGFSSLSRLEELEALALGVEGKLALWQALSRSFGADPRLGPIDLEALSERARSQRARLEQERLRAAEAAFN